MNFFSVLLCQRCRENWREISRATFSRVWVSESENQGSVNGGFQTVVRVFRGSEIPLPPFDLNLTSFLPQFYLFLTSFLPLFNLNLTSASSRISNHGLETTVYRLLGKFHQNFTPTAA